MQIPAESVLSSSCAMYRKLNSHIDDRGKPYFTTEGLKKVLVHPRTGEWKFGRYISKGWQSWMERHSEARSITPDWAQRIQIRMARGY